MIRTRYISISNCICPKCGNSFPVPRKANSSREKGHHKNLWCPFCKEVVVTTEIRRKDYYKNMAGEIL